MISHILRQAFHLDKQGLPQYLMDAMPCAICHRVVTEAYPIGDLISHSTAAIPDTFRASQWLCADCAACFVDSRAIVGSIFAIDTVGLRPLVAFTEGRPQWRDIVMRDDYTGQNCIAIITSNTKRRLWPMAVASYFGETWHPLFVDGITERNLTIDLFALRNCLRLVEEIYSLGISKQAMTESLIHPNNQRFMQSLGLSALIHYESQLAPWRSRDELPLSLFIAQKQEEI